MIYVQTADAKEIEIRHGEVLRYLGFGKSSPDAQMQQQIEAVTQEVFLSLSCRACFTLCDINVNGQTIDFGTFRVNSAGLSKNLRGCVRAVLFGATVGAGADRIIAKYSKLSPAAAVIAQAAGAAAIESWCDLFCARLSDKLKAETVFLRPRFSPGYGDFALSHQRDLFRVLECPKQIGVSLTDSLMMTPSKSVSAVIGISSEDTQCNKSGCEACDKREVCAYSRG